MTTPDSTRTAEVDALVLTRRAGAGQHLLAAGVDIVVPVVLAAASVVAFMTGAEGAGWMLLLAAGAVAAASVISLARTGRSLGRLAAGTRTVDRSTGVAAGASVIPAFFAGRLRTFDLHRGRDPFAAALAPLVFPDAAPAPIATVTATRHRAPVIELDSGQRISLEAVLVIGRDPSTPPDTPAHLYRWPDLSRTLSKSHARLEWDGRVLWVTDLGSTNGTLVRSAESAPQPLLPFQPTALPADATLELGDRVITVSAAA